MSLPDRVKETTTSTGTGNLTLGGAVTQFQPLSAAFTNGQSGVTLCIADQSGANWEVSSCTYINGTTISRDTVLSSSNGGALVSFGAGIKDVFYTLSAADIAKLAGVNSASATTIAATSSSKMLIVESGIPKQITVDNFLSSVGQTPSELTAADTLAGANVLVISQDGGATEVRTTLTALAAYIASVNGGGNTVAGAPTIGTATAGNASASVTFAAPASNGGSAITGYTVTSSPSGITGTGSASPIVVSGLTNGTPYTFTVTATNGVGVSAASAASNSATPAAGTSYTISGYSGNTVNATIDGTTPTNTFAPLKQFAVAKQSTNSYWNISPTPASARAGWGTSNSVAPAEITSGQNVSSGTSINGLVPMTASAAWENVTNLWVTVGSGTTTWYFWIKPVDGVAQCINPAGTTVTGA